MQDVRSRAGCSVPVVAVRRAEISRAIASSISLRNKRDLILAFVESVSVTSDVQADWHRFVEARREQELEEIEYEGLVPDKTRAFVERAFRDGASPGRAPR